MNKSLVISLVAGTLFSALSLPVFAADDSGTVNFA